MHSSAAAPDRRFRGFLGGLRASFRLRWMGRPHVDSDGLIQIGADSRISSYPVRSHLVVMRNAKLTIGNHVFVSYGAAISAKRSIQIGDNTRIGPFCLILDNDFHTVGDRDDPGGAAPIEIGNHVTLGTRVTVLRGARIGDGARVMSGSTVAGVIPSGAVISGVPARSGGNDARRNVAHSVACVIMRVFHLATLPSPSDGPAQIGNWTENGAIRLLLALEEDFRAILPVEQLRAARTVADVTELVTWVRENPAHASAHD